MTEHVTDYAPVRSATGLHMVWHMTAEGVRLQWVLETPDVYERPVGQIAAVDRRDSQAA